MGKCRWMRTGVGPRSARGLWPRWVVGSPSPPEWLEPEIARLGKALIEWCWDQHPAFHKRVPQANPKLFALVVVEASFAVVGATQAVAMGSETAPVGSGPQVEMLRDRLAAVLVAWTAENERPGGPAPSQEGPERPGPA